MIESIVEDLGSIFGKPKTSQKVSDALDTPDWIKQWVSQYQPAKSSFQYFPWALILIAIAIYFIFVR